MMGKIFFGNGLTKMAFWHLFDNHLKPNGLYVIEDWGTSYWDDWPDGKNFDLESYLRPHPKYGFYSLWLNLAKRLGLKTPLPCHSSPFKVIQNILYNITIFG